MPTFTISIDLSDDKAAELAKFAQFYDMTPTEILQEAIGGGLNLRQAMFEYDMAPPGKISDTIEDDLPF